MLLNYSILPFREKVNAIRVVKQIFFQQIPLRFDFWESFCFLFKAAEHSADQNALKTDNNTLKWYGNEKI